MALGALALLWFLAVAILLDGGFRAAAWLQAWARRQQS